MKLKIDNETLAEEFFECSRLIGIVAPLNDYHFIYHINQQLGFNFRKNNLLEIQMKKKQRNYYFSIFEYTVISRSLVHYLYNNQNDGEYLLPEFKHLDFLWLMKGDEIDEEEMEAITHVLKKIPGVQLIKEMTNEKIKNKQHLIL
ncbi:MAG: IPExxxVDY family protein [Ferruginibacter sp.]